MLLKGNWRDVIHRRRRVVERRSEVPGVKSMELLMRFWGRTDALWRLESFNRIFLGMQVCKLGGGCWVGTLFDGFKLVALLKILETLSLNWSNQWEMHWQQLVSNHLRSLRSIPRKLVWNEKLANLSNLLPSPLKLHQPFHLYDLFLCYTCYYIMFRLNFYIPLIWLCWVIWLYNFFFFFSANNLLISVFFFKIT